MSIGFDDEHVRADAVFGVDDGEYNYRTLSDRYQEALRQKAQAERRARGYLDAANNLSEEVATLRREVQKWKVRFDQLATLAARSAAARTDS